MDLSKIKNSKVLKWALIIGLPTVIVAGYYGYKYIKNRKSNNTDVPDVNDAESKPIDEKTMEFYKIRLPYITDVLGTIERYLKSKGLNYKFISFKDGIDDKSQMIIDYNIGISPSDYANLKSYIDELGANISLKKVTKDNIIVKPIENPICIVKRDEINSFQDFFESIGCLNYSSMFGYDLIGIKNIPNIKDKVSLDELRRVYNRMASEDFNVSEKEREELTNIMKKIYSE